ncbi:MAG: (Fe-S)-binding protein, partial [Pseudomonadota bacterium]
YGAGKPPVAVNIKQDYPEILKDDLEWAPRAESLAAKTYEITQFLTDVMGLERVEAELKGVATYHDSCSSQRAMGVKEQPRRLLASVAGLEVQEMEETEVCCGFGGTFCVKYPDISNEMVGAKAANVLATKADYVLAGDLGCLLNIAGKLKRDGASTKARHVVEVLAGALDEPPIGER